MKSAATLVNLHSTVADICESSRDMKMPVVQLKLNSDGQLRWRACASRSYLVRIVFAEQTFQQFQQLLQVHIAVFKLLLDIHWFVWA